MTQYEHVLTVEKEPDYMCRGHYHEGSKSYINPIEIWKLPIGTRLYALQQIQHSESSAPPNPEKGNQSNV